MFIELADALFAASSVRIICQVILRLLLRGSAAGFTFAIAGCLFLFPLGIEIVLLGCQVILAFRLICFTCSVSLCIPAFKSVPFP